MRTADLMRNAARAAGFDCRTSERGFSGVARIGLGEPLVLVVLKTGEFELAGEEIADGLRRGRGYAAMIRAIRAVWQARSAAAPVRRAAVETRGVDDRHLLDGVGADKIATAA